jgi:glutamine synthetase
VSLDLPTLTAEIASGRIDTVIVAITDIQGRLQGKRIHGQHFLDEIAHHGTEGCSYMLAVDVDMNPVEGFEMASWATGYGDFVMVPDFGTLRHVPWHPGTVMVQADVRWEDGTDVVASPRQILKRQLQRVDNAGLSAHVGTELEFLTFTDSYEQAWDSGYRNLTPANQYNVDYSILGTSRIEPLLRRIRLAMAGAGMTVESSKGECNYGQHEIVFRYSDALTACDDHVVYKNGAKEIAAQEGMAITFMAKYDEREGSSCHIHLSLREAGLPILAGDDPQGLSATGRHFIAGQMAHLREVSLAFAPNINSYKRFVAGSFAPTAIAWGRDNRTCTLRLVGREQSLRLENRAPGADANPYLAVAAMIAAGLDGIERELPLPDPHAGDAYQLRTERMPDSLDEAVRLWAESAFVTEVFGPAVQQHYANAARVELRSYAAAVTDWERYRGFERL